MGGLFKFQIPNSKSQPYTLILVLGIWNLGFGIWDLQARIALF